MEQWEILTLSGLISLVVSIVTAWITANITRKNDIKKHILEERSKQYFEIFSLIDELVSNVYKVYDRSYMEKFIQQKAKMKLLASKRTFQAYQAVFQSAIDAYNAYDIYCGYHNGENQKYFDSVILQKVRTDLKLSQSDFKSRYLPDRNNLTQIMETLYMQMRNDLGSNLR